MQWVATSRLLDALERITPSKKVSLIAREKENYNSVDFFTLLSMDLATVNIGSAKVKKFITKSFDLFDDEIDALVSTYGDLGDAIYYLDLSKDKPSSFTLKNILGVLQKPNLTLAEFKEIILEMSASERKWFVRFLIRTPRLGIEKGFLVKAIAKTYKKELSLTKRDCNFNTITNVVTYYEMGEEPPYELSFGSFVSPMLAKAVTLDKLPKEKILEYKYDGNRYQIHKEGDRTIIFNRKGKIVTPKFPDVVEMVKSYPNGIYDGEVFPIENDSPRPHKHMATRVHSKNVEEAILKCPVKWVVFDCMRIESDTLMNLPLRERVAKFAHLEHQSERAENADVLVYYNRAINDGYEGVMIKDANASYQAGSRSASWAKHKPARIDLDVVILSAKYGEGRKSNVFSSFEIAVKDETGYVSIGSVGTGLTDTQLTKLTNQLLRIVEDYKNGIYYFAPRLVLEVSADLISKDSKGNYGLRFPRVDSIREDKFAFDINTVEDLEEMR